MNPHQPAKDILSEYLQERGRRNRRNITVKCPECEGWKRVPNTGAAAYQPKYKDCPSCSASGIIVKPHIEEKLLPWAQRLEDALHKEFMEWWPTSEASRTRSPETSGTKWSDNPKQPVTHWLNVEDFLNERYPEAATGSKYGGEYAQPLIDKQLAADKQGTPQPTPEWLEAHGYIGTGNVITQAFLNLHNRYNRRPWKSKADKRRTYELLLRHIGPGAVKRDPLKAAAAAIKQAEAVLDCPQCDANTRHVHNAPATTGQDLYASGLVSRLEGEFNEWAEDSAKPNPYEQAALWKGTSRGPVGWWPNVESFLKERYPAAHKGFSMGMEDAQDALSDPDGDEDKPWLDGKRYETGPGAVEQYGYDPSEIAAAMLLLHNATHPGRDWLEADLGRITRIFQKRMEMNRAYEQTLADAKVALVTARRVLAMPAPAPKGLRFEHTKPVHPHADYLGRVEAYVDDHPVGHIEWLKEGNPISLVTDRKPGEVSFVFVHPNYRRQSIATEMFDWAKKHVAPDLHHSERRTDLGQKWIGYEQGRELEKAATAIRQAQRILAMPAVDAYDGHIPRKKRLTEHDYIPSGPWYHGTDYELEDGTILVPGGGESKYTDTMYKHPDMKNRMKWVWLAPGPNLANRWGQHVYEVEPLDEGPWPWNGDGDSFTQFVVPRARVVRKLDLLSAAAGVFAHKTAMPAPTPKGLTFHHHTSLDTIPDQTGYDEENDEYWEYPRFWPPAVEVRLNGEYVGHLQWEDFGYPDEPAHGTVSDIHVEEPYRRRGIATALFDEAKRIEPKVHHSSERTELGKAWVQYEESRHKTAMPAPLPEGLHFKYHHTNDSIPPEYSGVRQGGSHTFLAPAVAAYIGDEPVGYVEWWPTRRYPNAMNHYRHTMDKGKPGEVYYIYVRPDLRRHSIATHMFDWAKQNAEPDLHHSPKRSELGKQWIGYEEGRELERAAAAIREANTILAKWKVDPNFFAAVHEMAHVLDAVSGFKASDTLDDALFPVYEAETGKKMSKEPGGHWMDYNNWMRRNLPGRAWEKRLDAYGFPLGFDDFNPKEAIASAFVEHEIHPEASTPAMRALHQHVVDHSAKAGRPTNLTTFRPFGKRPPDIAPEDDWDSGKLPRAFMDGVQHVFTKYPQSRIVDMVEPLEMSKHGPSPVTQTAFGNSWDNKPRIEYDDRASFYPELVDESFRRQRNDGVISPWMWQEDDDTLAKAAAVLRIAEPLADAYDPNAVWLDDYYPPDKAKPTPAGKWYHVSPHAIAPGTKLIPRGGETSFSYQEHPDDTWLLPPGRQDWVWMDTEKGAQSWLGILHMNGVDNAYVYEVTPEVEGPWPYNGSGREGYVSPAATVVREIPHKDGKIQWDEIDQAEQAIKAASQILASEPMPLHRGVGFRKGDLPPELEQQFDAALAGEVHPEFVNNLLTHMHRDGEGMGGFWAHSKDGPWLAEGFSGRVQPDRWTNLPAHYSVVLSADWDGDNSIYDWNSDENYRKLLPGAKLRINRVRIKAPGIKKWIELGGDSTERYAQRTLTDDERREYESKGWRGQPCEDPDHHGIVMGRCADCGSIAMADEAIREAQKILAITEGVDYDDTAYWAAAWDDEDDEDEE